MSILYQEGTLDSFLTPVFFLKKKVEKVEILENMWFDKAKTTFFSKNGAILPFYFRKNGPELPHKASNVHKSTTNELL